MSGVPEISVWTGELEASGTRLAAEVAGLHERLDAMSAAVVMHSEDAVPPDQPGT